MAESVSQRKYSLAALIIGAALTHNNWKGLGAAVAVLLLYYAVNIYEQKR